jgi:hypothetical protein
MEKQVIEALARRAGLARALAEFPADVAAAAALAEGHGEALGQPADRVAEPWPPMRVAAQ